jgi:leucyl-tRNA synthetase
LEKYDPQAIEAKWQRVWEDARAFYVENPEPDEQPKGKFYMLEMLPYPSGICTWGTSSTTRWATS